MPRKTNPLKKKKPNKAMDEGLGIFGSKRNKRTVTKKIKRKKK